MGQLLWLLFLGFIFVVLTLWFIVQAIDGEQGTYEEREENPDLNTKDWHQHQKRLDKFGRSKYKRTTYYIGPKGGYYYYSGNGNKVYC